MHIRRDFKARGKYKHTLKKELPTSQFATKSLKNVNFAKGMNIIMSTAADVSQEFINGSRQVGEKAIVFAFNGLIKSRGEFNQKAPRAIESYNKKALQANPDATGRPRVVNEFVESYGKKATQASQDAVGHSGAVNESGDRQGEISGALSHLSGINEDIYD